VTKYRLLLLLILLGLAGGFAFEACSSRPADLAGNVGPNGVRRDVQAYIDSHYRDPKLHSITTELARALQIEVTHPDTADPAPGDNATDCLSDLFLNQSDDVLRTVEGLVANTPARMRAYGKYNYRFNGTMVHGAATTKEACNFDPNLLK